MCKIGKVSGPLQRVFEDPDTVRSHAEADSGDRFYRPSFRANKPKTLAKTGSINFSTGLFFLSLPPPPFPPSTITTIIVTSVELKDDGNAKCRHLKN